MQACWWDPAKSAFTPELPQYTQTNALGVQMSAFALTSRRRGASGYANEESTRMTRAVYYRGYAETYRITISDASPWLHRRLIVSFNKDIITNVPTSNEDATIGYWRVFNVLSTQNVTDISNLLFQGTAGRDWYDPMLAKVDTTMVKVFSDTMRSYSAKTTTGMSQVFKTWVPFNKTMVYSGDEWGAIVPQSISAAEGSPMRDTVVIDYLSRRGGYKESQLSIYPQGTLYWHER